MTNQDDKKIRVEVNKGHNRLIPSRKIGPDQASVASNVRFENGGVNSAPGHERIEQSQALDGASNQTFKTNLVTSDPDLKNATMVGAEGSVYYLRRRTQLSPCQPPSCAVRVGVFADGGNPVGSTANTKAVADLVKGWNPHAVVTSGDNVYAQPIDDSIGQWWSPYIYPYLGVYPGAAVAYVPTADSTNWTADSN